MTSPISLVKDAISHVEVQRSNGANGDGGLTIRISSRGVFVLLLVAVGLSIWNSLELRGMRRELTRIHKQQIAMAQATGVPVTSGPDEERGT